MSLPDLVEFNRPKKYSLLHELGSGACGKTVLLRDDEMEINVVAKKYCPIISAEDQPEFFHELRQRFREEARIMFHINHPNIVRVFNFFDYPESNTSYIIMEHISGCDFFTFIRENPDRLDDIFQKVISGFFHLEEQGILHRDIRPANLLISDTAEPKIIDFGFGKFIDIDVTDNSKSISLNWWCEVPPEFSKSIYDKQTEVYFVGKLFEAAITENDLAHAECIPTVRKMCEKRRSLRYPSFSEIKKATDQQKFFELEYSDDEIYVYRNFADHLSKTIARIGNTSKYLNNTREIIENLHQLHRSNMLEQYLSQPNRLVQIFLSGDFRYYTNHKFPVGTVGEFLELLRGLSSEKLSVLIANLHSRLDAIPRTEPTQNFDFDVDDEIPF